MVFFGNFLLTTKESYSCRGTKRPSLRPQAQHLLAAGAAKLPQPGRSKYPYPRCCQRQRRKRYKRSPEPTTTPTAPIPRDQHRQICTCPPRAKGPLDRRSKWFSLVPFFLQKKKVTRAGARNSPSRARRRNIDSPPQRRNPPRAKGSLDRRSKWFSLVTFFLQKKKVTRAGARNAPSRARRRKKRDGLRRLFLYLISCPCGSATPAPAPARISASCSPPPACRSGCPARSTSRTQT